MDTKRIGTHRDLLVLPATILALAGCSAGADSKSAESVGSQSVALSTVTVDTTGWTQVPGALVDPSCVYQEPNGSLIKANGDIVLSNIVIAHRAPCGHKSIITRPHRESAAEGTLSQPPSTDGWVEAVQTHLTGGTQFGSFITQFIVPAAPTTESDGQLIYLFPALESDDQSAILQPVLQWGVTGSGFGSHSEWTYAAWWGPDSSGNYHHSTGISPAVGDVLLGGMGIIISGNPAEWIVYGYDTDNTGLGAPNIYVESVSLSWTWGYAAVLETHGFNGGDAGTSCNDFPGGSSGSNLWLTPSALDSNSNTITPTYSTCVAPASCFVPEYSGPSCDFGAGSFYSDWYLTF
jgi:hypothetical protein